MNKPKSIEEWKEIITTARESGLSDKDWCLANDVSINTFYYNVRRLSHHACEVPEPVAQNVSLQPKVVPLEIINNPETISHPQLNQQTTPISINCNGISIYCSHFLRCQAMKSSLETSRITFRGQILYRIDVISQSPGQSRRKTTQYDLILRYIKPKKRLHQMTVTVIQ